MGLMTRRRALASAGGLGTGLAAGPAATNAMSQPQQSRARRLKVVVAGGHPADAEYGCGGTIARYTDLGHEVVLLHLNDGSWPIEKGGAPAHIRLAEASKAAGILKARPIYAGQANGGAVLDATHYDEFRGILEAERPDVLSPLRG